MKTNQDSLELLQQCRRLFVRRHEVLADIGIHDFEKVNPQRLWIDVDLYVPYEKSTPTTDDIHEVVDYDYIRHTVALKINNRRIGLQETLCDELATSLLAHESVFAVCVSTCKPDVYDDCESVGVEVFRIKSHLM
jgi:7,8-dihydroneopterin aldolase/epimerase/oxygenase